MREGSKMRSDLLSFSQTYSDEPAPGVEMPRCDWLSVMVLVSGFVIVFGFIFRIFREKFGLGGWTSAVQGENIF